MNRGYRLNNLHSFAEFSRTGYLANFTDMLGMTSGHEQRSALPGSTEVFPEYINPTQALGKHQKKKQVADRATQKSVTNYPGSKKPQGGSQLTEGVMKSQGRDLPASGQQWTDAHYGYRGYTSNFAGANPVNFNEGLRSRAGVAPKSNPYKTEINQSMPGDTIIMNPSENVGNPYNLIKSGEPTMPTRIKKKTPIKTLKRGSV